MEAVQSNEMMDVLHEVDRRDVQVDVQGVINQHPLQLPGEMYDLLPGAHLGVHSVQREAPKSCSGRLPDSPILSCP